MAEKRKTVDLTTGIGTLSFPRIFPDTKDTKDDGTDSYNIQILIPKTQREDARALLKAIKEVGEGKWGDKWKQVRNPLRDGDKEADELTEDGSTKGEKYPERLGCYFLNARSSKPVGVYDRSRTPITNSDDVYGGCKGKIAISFYPYSVSGNHGIGVGLNGVQKIADGESFGNARPSVESMFDMLEDEDDDDLDTDEVDEDEAPAPVKKAPARAVKAPTKRPAKKAVPVEDLDDEDVDDDEIDDDI